MIMKNIVTSYLNMFKQDRSRRRRLGSFVLILALLVAVGISWKLRYTGIALTNVTYCGLEEHTHTDDCYEKVLVCDLEESDGHTHTDACYEETAVLICGQEESAGHTHTDECYEEKTTLVCAQEERAGHTHTEECYDEEGNLICGQEESAGHTHTDACYETERVLICGLEETGETVRQPTKGPRKLRC